MHAVVMGEEHGGRARSFVLVHGLGMSGRYMMPTARLLAASGRVYVPDLPGFGRSRSREVLSIDGLADALAEWMEIRRMTGPVILVGNSLGAQVIVNLATRHPGHVDRAVLVGPTVDPSARSVAKHIYRLLVDVPREPAGLYWIALTDYLRAGLPRVLRTLRDALADPVESELARVRVPVLIVRGERDPIAPRRWAERAAELVRDGRLVTIPKVAHAVNFSAPERLAKEVLGFASPSEG